MRLCDLFDRLTVKLPVTHRDLVIALDTISIGFMYMICLYQHYELLIPVLTGSAEQLLGAYVSFTHISFVSYEGPCAAFTISSDEEVLRSRS